MLHILLHFLVPIMVARIFYRRRWWSATLILLAALLVDLDHLLADPIYDPARCSIGFHPLHTAPAILLYAGLFALPLVLRSTAEERGEWISLRRVHLLGLGLLIHMALDWIDCLM